MLNWTQLKGFPSGEQGNEASGMHGAQRTGIWENSGRTPVTNKKETRSKKNVQM